MACAADTPLPCPLCLTPGSQPFASLPLGTDVVAYQRCPVCRLTFMAPAHLPAPEAERAHYALHENNPDDPGYRQFLMRLAGPLMAVLPPGAQGLDFGCGPGPTLSRMLNELGFPCEDYDPLYAADAHLLSRQYDFVTCSEVVEHFHRPEEGFSRLGALLRPGGTLAIMTSWLMTDDMFTHWHYRRDPTHVCFYKPATFQWLAQRYGLTLTLPAPNIALLGRNRTSREV